MKWRQDMKNLVRTAGVLGQELKNAYRELITSIRSIDRDRIPNPKSVIRELKKILRTIVSAGTEKLGELWEVIQDLKDAITKITKEQMPDMRDVFGSIGEWWYDLRNTLYGMNIDRNIEWKKLGEKAKNTFRNKKSIPLDKVAGIIAGLGVPGLVLIALMAASPWYGAAAMTSSLAVLGPLGMAGGIAVLLVLVLIAKALAESGFEQVFREVLKESDKTNEEILEIIDSYLISNELKLKLREFIEKYSEENDEEDDNIENEEEDDIVNNEEHDMEKDEEEDIVNDEEKNDLEDNEEEVSSEQ